MADVLALPAEQRGLLTWIMREGGDVTLAQIAAHTGQDVTAARSTMATLIGQGFAEQQMLEGETHYRSRLTPTGPRRPRVPASIWSALDRPNPSQGTTPASASASPSADPHEKPDSSAR